MHRRRSALTLSTAAALLVATPLLTGCGTDAHPGAAAVMDGDRISMAQLQSRVGAVRDAQRAAPQGAEMIKRSGQLARAALDGMIRHRIVEQLAEDTGVSVSRREVQKARAGFEKDAGGAKAFESLLLQQQGIAPSEIDDRVWLELAVRKIARKSGIDLRSPQGGQALTQKFAKTSKDMNIDVNPRYGKWDSEKSALADSKLPWLNDITRKQGEKQRQA